MWKTDTTNFTAGGRQLPKGPIYSTSRKNGFIAFSTTVNYYKFAFYNNYFGLNYDIFFMLYCLKLVVTVAVTVLAALTIILFGLFDPHGKHVYCVTRFWSWMLLEMGGIKVNVLGLGRLDPRQQYLFMANHQSNVDIPVLVKSLPAFQLRWIAKRELLWVPFFGWAMWAGKHITVDRADGAGARGSLLKAQERIANGISVVVFPEGTRGSGGPLLPFKRGGFLLAVRAQVPIVPVTIGGSGKVLSKGDWRVRPGKIEVHLGDPIATTNYRPGSLRDLVVEVQRIVEKNLAINGAPVRESPKPSRSGEQAPLGKESW